MEIVLGVGSSHTPQASSGAQWWAGHADRDRANPQLIAKDGSPTTYDELVAGADPGIAAQLDRKVWDQKWTRVQDALAVLVKRLAEVAPDVAVIVGDDQRELFLDDGIPAIGMFLGEELWDHGLSEERLARMPADVRPAMWAAHGDEPEAYPVAQDLSRYLVESLAERDFDVTVFSRQPEARSLGHAFTFARRRLQLPASTPIVPIFLNTYYPPNVPSPGRCWELGLQLRSALDAWPGSERVAVVASGGLSHFVVDADFDRALLDAMAAHDGQAVGAFPRRLFRSGTSEGLNWIVASAMLHDAQMDVVDYVPGYRSPAGTGTGMAFATWQARERVSSAA
jgi:3-O-methylgallate 3,4-dioxygenase